MPRYSRYKSAAIYQDDEDETSENILARLCVCGLDGLLLTSGDNFMSIAPLEVSLLGKLVTCSMLILPAVNVQSS